jgi:integrase
MASINVRKESGKLYFDFTFRNQRCREQTDLKDTPANRKMLAKVLDRIQAEIMLGSFDYETTFPNSRMLKKIKTIEYRISAVSTDIPSFKVFAQIWIDEAQVQWRKSYTISIENIIFNRLIPYFGDKPIDQIKKADLLQLRKELTEIKKKNGDLFSPNHVNRHLKVMRMIMVEASDRYEFNCSYKGIKPLKIPKSDIRPFNPEEINKILSNVRKDFRDYFCIRIFTGMRTGEIDGLKWCHVDFDKKIIKVRETIVAGEVSYTKNDFSQRDVQMSDLVFAAMKRMHPRTKSHDYVFVNGNGNPLCHNLVTKRIWYPLLKALNIPRRVPYQMRHTAATLWLASGESPEWIANQMGHANTEMLFRVYSRYVPNLTRQDGSVANRMFSNILGEQSDE